MSFPHNNVVEIGAKLVRRQTDDFAPGADPSARAFGGCLLALAVPVVINQERERLDASENWKVRHAVGTARRPGRLQQRAAMGDVEGGSERSFDTLTEHEAGGDGVIRP